jgi:hypothetical protein
MAFAYEIVSQQFGNIQMYAGGAFEAAQAAITALTGALGDQSINTTAPTFEAIDPAQSFDIDPAIAQARAKILELVGDVSDNTPDPGDAPPITDHDLPSEPTITWPTAPTLNDITVPDFQEESVPGLTASLPSFSIDLPELEGMIRTALTEAVVAPSYSDLPLTEAIHAKLKSNIENGGTMLDPLVEDDIWDRNLERDEQALQDAIDKATGQWAKFGFSLPDGLLAGTILAINNEYMNKRLDRSREIAVKQAELEQVGLFKSIELGNSFSAMWYNVLDAYKQRAFNLTKLTADTILETYKERTSQYNLQLELFKADLVAWKTAIEREMLRAETYKARIAGLQLVIDIDESKVKIYTSQLEAVAGMIKVWDTQIRAVATMYEAEKSKMEAYRAKVEAYAMKVDAASRKFTAGMEGVKTLVAGWSASAEVRVRLLEMQNKVDLAGWDMAIKQWEVELQTKERELTLRLDALKAAAQTSGNIAAGALSAAHASAQASFGASSNTNYNHNYLE